MPTTVDLATKVLKRAKVLDPSENPTAAESADVIAVMNSVYDSMKERGHIAWTLTEIPTRYEDPFVTIVAFRVANDFGKMTAELAALYEVAKREIWSLNERKVDPRIMPECDY